MLVWPVLFLQCRSVFAWNVLIDVEPSSLILQQVVSIKILVEYNEMSLFYLTPRFELVFCYRNFERIVLFSLRDEYKYSPTNPQIQTLDFSEVSVQQNYAI